MSGELVASIVRPGLTTVQDGGRPGYAALGVPRSGAWHRERYLLATALISGRQDATVPALEILDGTLELNVEVDTAVAVVGPAEVTLGGQPAALGAVMLAERGTRWLVRRRGPGPVYVVLSGWRPPTVLGSAATDTFSRLGGEVLSSATVLPGRPPAGWQERVGAFLRSTAEHRSPVSILPAGHPGLPELTDAPWTVRSTARSGIRLGSGRPGLPGTSVSSPTIPGAVQLTPSGEAIVLGPDGGITGGYPVVGVVAAADLDRLSLLSEDEAVTFRLVDVGEAKRRYDRRQVRLRRALAHVHRLG